VFRDGGSIEFYVERDGIKRHVWLESSLFSSPQALIIDSVTMETGNPLVRELLSDIECWWRQIPVGVQSVVAEVMAHKGPHYNASAEIHNAIALSRVLMVRDYVRDVYCD